ncbi:MAG: hypothetical protein ACE5PT_11685 [Gemmatimonadales bacterium]
MRTRFPTLAIALLLAGGMPLQGQVPAQDTDSLRRELARLRTRLDSLEALIEHLLAERAAPSPAEDELAALRRAAREAVEEAAPREEPTEQGSRTRNLQILNPEISVTGDFVGSFIRAAGEPGAMSAAPREFEFSFQAALDPYTRTKIFVTREEEFEIAGLAQEGGEEEGQGFEIEEGYMYWVGLPGGLGLKLGKFRQEIGLYNRWHTHALFEVERPLAAATFLGEDGLIQTGISASFPSVTLGPATQTLVAEVTRGNNEALFGSGGELSYLARFQSFWDLGATYVQLGGTGVYGENDEASLVSKLLALDLSLRWTPSRRALYRDLNLKGELYLVEREETSGKLTAHGGYGQVNYRLSRRWIAGARADYLAPFGDQPSIVQLAPSLSWWQSEWVRLRIQYNYLKRRGLAGNHTVLLQAVWAVGPHKHEIY